MGTLAHSYPQGKGITGQEKVAHTPWLGRPARTQRVGWGLSWAPECCLSILPRALGLRYLFFAPTLKNMGALSSTGVKSDLNPPSGTKQFLPAITLHLGSHQESV